jgi:RNA polymerase sigma-70 factor (ECF subfamily)
MKKKKLVNSRLSRKETKEFEFHVKHNMKKAYFCALGFVGSHDTAVELSQQAFVRAYRNYKSFDKNKNFFTWYYKILKNICLNFIRDSKKKFNDNFLEFSDMANSGDNPDIIVEKEELKNIIQKAILEISEMDREIIILKEFQNFSYKEISKIMEIPIGTVMSKLFYARKRLAEKLKGVL